MFSAVNGELINNIEVLDHLGELLETNLSIIILISLNDCSVDQLLKLNVFKVGSDHHFEDLEELTIADVAIVVDVIDLESKSELLLLGRPSRKRVKTLDELQEGDAAIFVFVEYLNYSLNKRVIGQFWNIKELFWLQGTTLILVEFAEILVELL